MLVLMEDTTKIFIRGLRRWAKLNRVTQTKLGKIIGKSQTAISDYYNDVSRPTIDSINLWVKSLGLDQEEIMSLGRKELRIEITPDIKQEIKQEIKSQLAETNKVLPYSRRQTDEFQQPELAERIRVSLLALEKANPKKMHKILRLIKMEMEETGIDTEQGRAASDQ